MNPCSVKDVRAELSRIGLQPSRKFGQNFLIDRNILDIIIDAADISAEDRILEVGPGLGVLTGAMAERCGQLVCVEKDFKLTDYLKDYFADTANVEIVGSDIMRINFSEMDVNKCVSNLPYSCGSRFLVDFTSSAKADLIVVMLQDEVAEKICAKSGSRDFGLMGLMMQIDYKVDLVKKVSRGCFWPRPEVNSCVVRLKKKSEPALSDVERIFLRKFAKSVFSQRRKKMGVPLRMRAGHDKDAAEAVSCFAGKRPEQLLMEEWFMIARTLCGR